ncbi:MAG: 30S ribosomal protein S9 [Candidatus Omnitrophica bacterium]|nr:30S ribosomal protein S9 [Candidatus Omnitrophota bacterium]
MVEVVKYSATGRRKTSVARVCITPGTGEIKINNRPLENYFVRETDRLVVVEPLKTTNTLGKFNVDVQVSGGGMTGQVGALRLGLSRALSLCDPESKTALKKVNLLSRDPRMKERKKPGQKGARKKFQWVKR